MFGSLTTEERVILREIIERLAAVASCLERVGERLADEELGRASLSLVRDGDDA
jgi:hypothetical protein